MGFVVGPGPTIIGWLVQGETKSAYVCVSKYVCMDGRPDILGKKI